MTLPLWLFILLTVIGAAGSIASIVGLLFSIYVYHKELDIEQEVSAMKNEEESWHKDRLEGRKG